jgi:uncharacterized protein YndB with AHSA1/START domain
MMGVKLHHTSFVIGRRLPGSPTHAFHFWTEHALKRRWNSCHPDWTVIEDSFDCRIGGSETLVWRMPDGAEQSFVAHYLDILAADRIVYAYAMRVSGAPLSSSLVTVEFSGTGAGCLMTYTEQAVFWDEKVAEQRRSGTGGGFDRLAEVLAQELAAEH